MASKTKNIYGKGPVAASIVRLHAIDEALASGKWWTAELLVDRINSHLSIHGYREVTKRQIQLDFRTLGELCCRKFPDLLPDESENESDIPLYTEIYIYQGAPGRSPRKYRQGVSFFSRGDLMPQGKDPVNKRKCLHHYTTDNDTTDNDATDHETSNGETEEIIFWLGDKIHDLPTSTPLHDKWPGVVETAAEDYRKEYPHLDGGHFMSMRCNINSKLKQQLMHYMDDLTVIRPKHLAVEMRRIISNMYKNYNS